jgi:hypothetical protein
MMLAGLAGYRRAKAAARANALKPLPWRSTAIAIAGKRRSLGCPSPRVRSLFARTSASGRVYSARRMPVRPPRPQYARITAREPMTIQVTSIVPILRIFDIAKAGKLYQGFLGFKRRDHPANMIFQYLRSIAARRGPRYFFRTAGFNLKLEVQRPRLRSPSRAAPEQTRGLRVRVPPWHRDAHACR